MDNFEICCMSVVEMADAVKTKRLSPVEIMGFIIMSKFGSPITFTPLW